MGLGSRTVMVVAISLGLLGGGAAGGAVFAGTSWVPPGDTIVSITGTKMSGFHIEHYDGTEQFPPTSSEAVAECLEYDERLARVRCKVAVRTWYSALGDTKRALHHARSR